MATRNTYLNNKRFILGTIDQKTLSIMFRVDLNLTPEFSVQYYGSPFISKGSYSELKRVTVPDSKNYNERFRSIRILSSTTERTFLPITMICYLQSFRSSIPISIFISFAQILLPNGNIVWDHMFILSGQATVQAAIVHPVPHSAIHMVIWGMFSRIIFFWSN